jgi:very-short-patch-repair endonuclease
MSKGKYLNIKTIKKHARELRTNVTSYERILWEELRGR